MSSPVEEDKIPELDEEFLQRLEKFYKKIGDLSSVMLDPSGRVIDGFHRLAIDSKRPKLIISWLSEKERPMSCQYLFKCPTCGEPHEIMELVRRPR